MSRAAFVGKQSVDLSEVINLTCVFINTGLRFLLRHYPQSVLDAVQLVKLNIDVAVKTNNAFSRVFFLLLLLMMFLHMFPRAFPVQNHPASESATPMVRDTECSKVSISSGIKFRFQLQSALGLFGTRCGSVLESLQRTESVVGKWIIVYRRMRKVWEFMMNFSVSVLRIII